MKDAASVQPVAKYRKDYTPPSHFIDSIDLMFQLHTTQTLVTATSQVTANGDDNSLALVGDQLPLKEVSVNGALWSDYEQTDDGLTLSNLPAKFELKIVTQIDPSANTALEGLYLSDGAFCTQCEAEGFRRITYFLDRPDVLAKYTTTIEADQQAFPFLLSNGNKVDEGQLENGRHWVKWQDPHPKPCYLFALVAGDFDQLVDSFTTRSGREVALEIFVDKGNIERAHHAMLSLKNSMKWDEERFGLEYDLDIYMIVAVDFFNMGAMENKGLNVFNSKFVLADQASATDRDYLGIEAVIGHEYFHNWTGNRVTCRDWFQLSLKEGLTVFRDQEFSSDLGSRSVNRINNVRIIRGPQFAEDASPMSHPIRPEKVIEMNNFYTLTVYEKGSEVIRMIHTLLGEQAFQAGIKLYFERHDGTAATCDDFVAAMQDASGVDLTQFKLWYSQSGTPTVTVTDSFDAVNKTYTLDVRQHTPPTATQQEKQALHIPFDIELYRADGSVIPMIVAGEERSSLLHITQDAQQFVFEQVDEKPTPSLFREFTAPVKLEYQYTEAQLVLLMKCATNEVSRWDAGQSLMSQYIKQAVSNNTPIALSDDVIQSFAALLSDKSLDNGFVAEALTLPPHSEVSGWFDVIDVDAISKVLKELKLALAKGLEAQLFDTYQSLASNSYDIAHASIAKRSLRNTCLGYLSCLPAYKDLAQAQFDASDNMTDTIGAMSAANQSNLECRESLMEAYSERWSDNGLVMDKWFMLQGTKPDIDALSVVKASMDHVAFSMQNPNRVRCLIGAFFSNPVAFHAIDGSGYRFAGEMLAQLNSSNPQVASRLIDPLLKFARYDEKRKALMRAELETLQNISDLAKDLFEKVEAALK
ncbi:aminopeptidase N [Vibrio sp. UCD-FRSSP16_10]|uniref:aminopeptidase N n=1 Tax=unclassified Vibrio TaxID=2614977 RepID=UPI0007FEE053|nr:MULTISPECIES: aminopeptidase N [unclassified Vibrio]OBT12203.1 aminopeptidase N [Vibrio sp. UCD-FRSSP16_30]OBT20535.1 aminopeptidase N [Vibrio sp. UCD-FRSSP16_10]